MMQVILMQDIPKLGNIGDLVKVKGGYARNYLLPNRMAVLASNRNVKQLEHDKRIADHKLAQAKTGAEDVAKQIGKLALKLERRVGEQGKLFGSVTTMDLAKELAANGFELDRRQVILSEPIKQLGAFEVSVKLHKDVVATLKGEVVSDGQAEADQQAAETPVEEVDEHGLGGKFDEELMIDR